MQEEIFTALEPQQILNDPLLNKGTAFTEEEREELGLHGLLPFRVATIEEQVKRRYDNFCMQADQISKYVFLTSLQNHNETLFYRLIQDHVTEMLPLVYTPTVGDISAHFSKLYRESRGLYLSYPLRDQVQEMVDRFARRDLDVIVITDGERILGLGDLGVGGMAIPMGKLALYTLFGGIHPAKALPICVDVGTNNPELLNNPQYLGWSHPRITGSDYDAFLDAIVTAIKKRFPHVLLQWEDFSKIHARPLLERYQQQICSFNDDIQGTAAVALAAIYAAIRLKKESLQDQRIAVLGGGNAGMGICRQIVKAMVAEGMREEEARERFYVVDTHGLLREGLTSMDREQKNFAQPLSKVGRWEVKNKELISLLEVVQNAKPTILIGVSAQRGAFTEEILRAMSRHTERPIVFPLSNPTDRSEANPTDILAWTKGKAIIATGSPFPSTAQCNNVYIYPGLGLGVIAVRARAVSDRMLFAAAKILSEHAPVLHYPGASLFPRFEDLRSVSKAIAQGVAKVAEEEGLAQRKLPDLEAFMWAPHYPLLHKRL